MVPPIDPTCPVRVELKDRDQYGTIWVWTGGEWHSLLIAAPRQRCQEVESLLMRVCSEVGHRAAKAARASLTTPNET